MIQALSDKIDLIKIAGDIYKKRAMMGAHKSESTPKKEAHFVDFAYNMMNTRTIPLMATRGFGRCKIKKMAGLARPFFKLILIKCTIYLSVAIDERHDSFDSALRSLLKLFSQGGIYARQII